ncbi:MAG: hypothetical protein RMI30_03910 [Thermodesulfovibrio sp.]|nr:hypothetical protein [Thermodesulfovibrio sp.]MDW7998580.1 hypothetical protein [Thermodesulfovibrio sp.]
MIDLIKKDFLQGLKTFKFWATVISERVKIELNAIKLIGEINKLNQKKGELLESIGKQIYISWERDLEIRENEKISSLIRQIREIEIELEDKRKKLSELEEITKWKF